MVGWWRPIRVEKNRQEAMLKFSFGELIRVMRVYRKKCSSSSSLYSGPTKSPNKNLKRTPWKGGEK
jgi:uncharacterized protein YbjQ (UPF0145 family)